MLSIFDRAKLPLSLKLYAKANPLPIVLPNWFAPTLPAHRQYILRMCVRNELEMMLIPPQLWWLQRNIQVASYHQQEMFGRNHPYVYITVRHGITTSVTDDDWHVDGFSLRKPHLPEQNYIFTTPTSTEYLNQQFVIPKSFHPLKHNINHYFQDNARKNVGIPKPSSWCLIDPYIVHRRPPGTTGRMRTMIRITFCPLEIEDDNCTQNPLLPTGPYMNKDIRLTLSRWKARK